MSFWNPIAGQIGISTHSKRRCALSKILVAIFCWYLMMHQDFSHFIQAPAIENQPLSAAKALWLFHHFPRRWPPFWPVPGLGGEVVGLQAMACPSLLPMVEDSGEFQYWFGLWIIRSAFLEEIYIYLKKHINHSRSLSHQNSQIAHQSRHMAPPDLCPSTWCWPSPLRDRCLSCHAGMVLWSKRICLQCTHHVCSNRPVLAMKSRSFMHQQNAGLFCMCLRARTSLLSCFRPIHKSLLVYLLTNLSTNIF